MDNKKLSELYFTSTSRVTDVAQTLYEKLHNYKGIPVTDEELVRKMITNAVKEIRSELDLIKTAVAETNEHYTGKWPIGSQKLTPPACWIVSSVIS